MSRRQNISVPPVIPTPSSHLYKHGTHSSSALSISSIGILNRTSVHFGLMRANRTSVLPKETNKYNQCYRDKQSISVATLAGGRYLSGTDETLISEPVVGYNVSVALQGLLSCGG